MRIAASTAAALAAAALGLGAAAGVARAEDFWSAAAVDDADATRTFDEQLASGDNLATMASSAAPGSEMQKRLLERALLAYQNAELARPEAPEPHYKRGLIRRLFYVECAFGPTTMCGPGAINTLAAADLADEWTAFERLAPLDPRIDFDFLFERAIANTKATANGGKRAKDRILAAAADYQAAFKRMDLDHINDDNARGNLAESWMMVGDLDAAILQYQETLRHGGDTGLLYGLAVAYDRDEQGTSAREIIRALGGDAFDAFRKGIHDGHTFFVPAGEQYYYLALGEEALGDVDDAIDDWQQYIDSNAHPEFQPRARANRAALLKQPRRARPAPRRTEEPEP